jgi:hypothetical protein
MSFLYTNNGWFFNNQIGASVLRNRRIVCTSCDCLQFSEAAIVALVILWIVYDFYISVKNSAIVDTIINTYEALRLMSLRIATTALRLIILSYTNTYI